MPTASLYRLIIIALPRSAIAVAALLACAVVSGRTSAASSASRYAQLGADMIARPGSTRVLALDVEVVSATSLYVQSDGWFAPAGAARAEVSISVDGQRISNRSAIDWRPSKSIARNLHSFNLIGATSLAPGKHRVVLSVRVEGTTVNIGRGANLSALVDAAASITTARLRRDSEALDFDTRDTPDGTPLPRRGVRTVLSTVPSIDTGNIVAMASGSSHEDGGLGDAMWGIFLDGREPGVRAMTWSINDLWEGAEKVAPMFSQALFRDAPADGSVQLVASESPYYQPKAASTNAVRYRVDADTMLVALRGGMTVRGAAEALSFDADAKGLIRRYAYVCVGSNGFKPTCPASGTAVVVSRGQLCIPPGHNGIVLLSAKSRVQGDDNDRGGTVTLGIRIDGVDVGSIGRQQLGPYPHVVSTRTVGSSYFATGGRALTIGCHVVESVGRADVDFRNLALNADLPLLWFD